MSVISPCWIVRVAARLRPPVFGPTASPTIGPTLRIDRRRRLAQIDGAAGVGPQHRDQPFRLARCLVDDGAEIRLAHHGIVEPPLPNRCGARMTSAGAAPRSSRNSCSPAGVGTTSLPSAASRYWRFRPLMIWARVAGVPMPFASPHRSATAAGSASPARADESAWHSGRRRVGAPSGWSRLGR